MKPNEIADYWAGLRPDLEGKAFTLSHKMKPEIIACLELIEEVDNDCKDSLIANWSEEDPAKKMALQVIYERLDKKRAKLFKKLVELINKWQK